MNQISRTIMMLVLMLPALATGSSFTTIEHGAYSGITQQRYVLVDNAKDFAALWKQHTSRKLNAPAAPLIDFDANVIIAAFLGERPTGGYGIEITSVNIVDDIIDVQINISNPPRDALLSQAFTAPYHLIKVPVTNKQVKFEVTID
jgi:hypothetical protein